MCGSHHIILLPRVSWMTGSPSPHARRRTPSSGCRVVAPPRRHPPLPLRLPRRAAVLLLLRPPPGAASSPCSVSRAGCLLPLLAAAPRGRPPPAPAAARSGRRQGPSSPAPLLRPPWGGPPFPTPVGRGRPTRAPPLPPGRRAGACRAALLGGGGGESRSPLVSPGAVPRLIHLRAKSSFPPPPIFPI